MSSKDRQPYLTATVLDQPFLDACHDNLVSQFEVVVDIEGPLGTIRASDRNKYVGGDFYEALLTVPTITRTVGDWLAPELEFSELSLELSNADGRFNDFLPGGDFFDGWIGKSVEVRLGLRDVASTYFTIFRGTISQAGGFARTTSTILLRARDDMEKLARSFPREVFGKIAFPKIEETLAGKFVPIIYGDWTVNTNTIGPSVPAFVVNGGDPLVFRIDTNEVLISQSSPGVVTYANHNFNSGDPLELETDGTLPTPFTPGVAYFAVPLTADTFALSATAGGPPINTIAAGSGNHRVKLHSTAPYRNAQCRMSNHALTLLDVTTVQLRRGDERVTIAPADIVTVGVGFNTFEVVQNAVTQFLDAPLSLKKGDQFFVKLKGKSLGGGFDENIVSQARDILLTYGGIVAADLDANWTTYRNKSTPPQSAISSIKSRVWLQEPQPVIQYVLSMFEQVRLEAFVSRGLKIKIGSLHFEDFDAAPSHLVKAWDVERSTLKPMIDERNNFNRARGGFAFLPDVNENGFFTPIFRNQLAIVQTGREISKQLTFPNLHVQSQVAAQVGEILKLASSYLEKIEVTLTWRSLLQDVGGYVALQLKIGPTTFDSVPCLIRQVGYDPNGLRLRVVLWSFAMVPFPGWAPGYAGTVGGNSASITQEP